MYLLGDGGKRADSDRVGAGKKKDGFFKVWMRRWAYEYRQANGPLSAIFKPLMYEGSLMVRTKRILLLWTSILISFSCEFWNFCCAEVWHFVRCF
jgi:hypothetical protein